MALSTINTIYTMLRGRMALSTINTIYTILRGRMALSTINTIYTMLKGRMALSTINTIYTMLREIIYDFFNGPNLLLVDEPDIQFKTIASIQLHIE